LPLPKETAEPPSRLEATWTLPSGEVEPFGLHFHVIPLTGEVVGDAPAEGDSPALPLSGLAHLDAHEDSLPEAWRFSRFYRAVVPLRRLLLAELLSASEANLTENFLVNVPVANLEVQLFGETLWHSSVELLRWRRTWAVEGDRLQPHLFARLCVAAPSSSNPWRPDEVAACEAFGDVAQYLPRSALSADSLVEIVLRSRVDPYVVASHLTRGCSNCHGRPYGQSLDGENATVSVDLCQSDARGLLVQFVEIWPWHEEHCFARPRRSFLVAGLALLGACTTVACAEAVLSQRGGIQLRFRVLVLAIASLGFSTAAVVHARR